MFVVRKSLRSRAAAGFGCSLLALACSSKPGSRGDADGVDAGFGGSLQQGFGGAFFFESNAGSSSGGSAAGGSGGAAGNGSSSGGSAGFGGPDASYPNVSFPFDPARVTPDACASVQGEATVRTRPMDVIISIDNSSSMDSEIEEVQTRINDDFYAILEASGIDYRVIMVSRYGKVRVDVGGSDNPVHISPPLGGSTCTTGAAPCEELVFPAHGKFFHYSADIESKDMWQKLLGGLFKADELADTGSLRDDNDQFFPWVARAPTGYDEFLREDSYKVIVGITDDTISGPEFSGEDSSGATWSFSSSPSGGDFLGEAQEFDTAIRTISPEHFGALEDERNYSYYAIAGFPTPDYATIDPSAPVITGTCNNDGNAGVNAGQGHQELARLTGGLRYSSCRTANYDPVFTAIAQAVVEGAQIPCEFDFPPPPDGELLDLDRLLVTWAHDAGSQAIPRVDDCAGAGYLLDYASADAGVSSEPQRIVLCPDSCTAVQAEDSSRINVDFGCIGQ